MSPAGALGTKRYCMLFVLRVRRGFKGVKHGLQSKGRPVGIPGLSSYTILRTRDITSQRAQYRRLAAAHLAEQIKIYDVPA